MPIEEIGRKQEIHLRDFSGGLIDSIDPVEIPDNACRDCFNVICKTPGSLEARPDYAMVHDIEATNPIINLYPYYRYSPSIVRRWVGNLLGPVPNGNIIEFVSSSYDGAIWKIGAKNIANAFIRSVFIPTNILEESDILMIKWRLQDIDGQTITYPRSWNDLTLTITSGLSVIVKDVKFVPDPPAAWASPSLTNVKYLMVDIGDLDPVFDHTIRIIVNNGAAPYRTDRLMVEEITFAKSESVDSLVIASPTQVMDFDLKLGSGIGLVSPDKPVKHVGFTQLIDTLIFCTGDKDRPPLKWSGYFDEPVKLLGDTSIESLKPEADLRYPTVYKEKVFGTLASDPSRIVWSETFKPDEWPGINTAYFGDYGDEITNLIPFSDGLLILKNHSIYTLKGTWIEDFVQYELASDIGCVGPKAACVHENILYFASFDGFYSFDGASFNNISEKRIPKLWKEFTEKADLLEVSTFSDGEFIYIVGPFLGSSGGPQHGGEGQPEYISIIYSILHGSFWKWGVRFNCGVGFQDKLTGILTHYFGGENGVLYEYGNSVTPFRVSWVSKKFDLQYYELLKKFKDIFIEVNRTDAGLLINLDNHYIFDTGGQPGSFPIKKKRQTIHDNMTQYRISEKVNYRFLELQLYHNHGKNISFSNVLIPIKLRTKKAKIIGPSES